MSRRDTPLDTDAMAALAQAAPEADLDTQIALAEARVMARDARVLHQGRLLRQRLSTHGTQARLAGLGAIGITATLLLLRRRKGSGDEPAAAQSGQRRASRPARPSWWVQWLPLLLQVVSAGSVRPSRPPGLVGWMSTLLSARQRWAGRRDASAAASDLAAADRQATGTATPAPRRRG